MTYTLTITIDPADVSRIVAAGQNVTVLQAVQSYVQSVEAAAATFFSAPVLDVAWLAFSPFPSNTVTWSPAYSLYAAVRPPAGGSAITPQATQAAQERMIYPFQNNVFGAPADSSTPGYLVQNLQGTSMTFGLAAAATVNTVVQPVSPMSAATLLPNQIGWLTPQASVAVFLSTTPANGTAFFRFDNPTFYSMSGGTVSLQYQASRSAFVLLSP